MVGIRWGDPSLTAHVAALQSAISPKVWGQLTCSHCGQSLQADAEGARCVGCGMAYPLSAKGALDLRLRRAKSCELKFELGTSPASNNSLHIEPLQLNRTPKVEFGGTPVPYHMTRELMSYFSKAKAEDSLLLDLGCGAAVHRDLAQKAGFEWVGADYDPDSAAPILADAHALPFADNSFECILSVAAIHLFRYPLVMMKEAYRVMKPGGVFLGTVAFLEPFHDGGFYHHTHLGAINSLQYGGFTVDKLAPSREWTALTAQAAMALFPKMPGVLSRSIVYPVHLLHRLWWQVGRAVTHNPNAQEDVRIRNTTGAFSFVARKGDGPA